MTGSGEKPGVIRLSRRVAHQNSKWDVCFDHIRAADGYEVADYMVLAPQRARDDLITGVAVLPVQDGKLILLRMYRYAVGRWTWEIPRGFIDPDEAPTVAARRELAEETGLCCAEDGLTPLGICSPETGTIAGRGLLFAALGCEPLYERDRTEPGLGAMRAFTADEALGLADGSEVEDGFTLAALYRYARLGAPGARR